MFLFEARTFCGRTYVSTRNARTVKREGAILKSRIWDDKENYFFESAADAGFCVRQNYLKPPSPGGGGAGCHKDFSMCLLISVSGFS